MAESKSKFAGTFEKAPTPEPAPPPPERIERAAASAAARAARPIGRPPGKRSDPAWKQYSVLLKRETQREAASILRDRDEGLDQGLDLGCDFQPRPHFRGHDWTPRSPRLC